MKYTIIVDKQSRINPSSERKQYEIDIEELRTDGNTYDSLVITREETYVMRRLKLSEYHVLTVLEEPVKEVLTELKIQLFEGDNYIYLIDMTGNKFYAEYLIKNDFNDIYATKNEMYSTINQTAQGIELIVSQKVDENEIISKINQSAEQIEIEANKININGVISANGNFKVDTNGNMECNNAKIKGGSLQLTGGTADNPNFDIQSSDGTESIIAIPGYIACDKILGDYTNDANIQANEYQSSFNCSSKNFSVNGHSYDDVGFIEVSKNGTDNIYSSITVTDDSSFSYIKRNNNLITNIVDSKGAAIHVEALNSATHIYATGIETPQLTQTSLESQKKNFEKLQSGLDIINDIDIYKYNLKSEEDNTKKHIGFVIGDEYNYSKEVTSSNNEGVDIYSFVAICCKAIQEQQGEIEKLKQRIEKLEVQNGNN